MNQEEHIQTEIFSLPIIFLTPFEYISKQNGRKYIFKDIHAAGEQISNHGSKSLILTLKNDSMFNFFNLTVIPLKLIEGIPRTDGDYAVHEVYVSLGRTLKENKNPTISLPILCNYCFDDGRFSQYSSNNVFNDSVHERGLSLTYSLFIEIIKHPCVDQYIQEGLERIVSPFNVIKESFIKKLIYS